MSNMLRVVLTAGYIAVINHNIPTFNTYNIQHS